MSRIARILLNIPSSSLQISSLVLDLWRWRQCNQSSNMNSFLVNFGIFFLRLEVRHLPMRMKPPKNLLLKWVCEHFFNVRHGVEPYVLEDDSVNRVSSARLSSRYWSPNSVLSKDFFLYINGLRSRMYRWRIAAAVAAAAAAAFEEAGISRIVEATVSRCTLEGVTFVSTLFEFCEPYSWYSTVGLEDSKHILSKFSSFLRNFLTVTHHPRIIKIHPEIFRSIQIWYLCWVIFFNSFLQFFHWYQSFHSMSTLIIHKPFGNEMILLGYETS